MSFDIIIGIDPGKVGAFVALRRSDRFVLDSMPMGSLRDSIDFLQSWNGGRLMVFIEKAQAMPKNGSVAMFNYGQGFGEILGALTAIKIPYEMVTPQGWQKQMCAGIPKTIKPKERAARAVEQLFPGVDLGKANKAQREGLYDALLIAEYGRMKHS